MDGIAGTQVGGNAGFSAAPRGGSGVPEARDVDEFNRVYGSAPSGAEQAAGMGETQEASFSGSLLERVESLGRDHGVKVEALQKALDRISSGGMSVRDMLDVQLKLADLTLTETYALKLGEKGAEGVKTLFTNP